MRKIFYFFLYIVFIGSMAKVFAQTDYLIPINKGLEFGNISYTATPFDIGSIREVFDGSVVELARSQNINPMVITLQFSQSIPLLKSRINSATDAAWTLEVAQTLRDLDKQTGSYAKLVNNKTFSANTWDTYSSEFAQEAVFIRLSLTRTVGDDYVHLNEWELYGFEPSVSNPAVCPSSYFLTPGFIKKFKLGGIDTYGLPGEVSHFVFWSSSDTNIATVDTTGLVTAKAPGTATISAYHSEFTYEGKLTVGNTFIPVKADKKLVKVALLVENPFIPGSSTIRWNQRLGWNDPIVLAQQLAREMNQASDNTVEFKIVKTTYGDIKFTNFEGQPVDSSFFYHRYLTKAGTDSLLYWAGHLSQKLKYDYNAMLDFYKYCEEREQGNVDEVWIFTHPAAALYESTLAGKNGFWYNSPPLAHTSCVKLLPIMGFNNSVSVDYAMHSIGHRAESALAQVFGGWNPTSNPAKTPFDLFTRLDKDFPGGSQVGNIHFSPNSIKDYEYGSTLTINNYASNWSQYPLMGNDSTVINCNSWNCDQLGAMKWWYEHLPKYKGITNGVLNDWWNYIVHYEEALAYAKALDPGCGNQLPHDIPTKVESTIDEDKATVHPNPSKGTIHIRLKSQNNKAHFQLYNASGKSALISKELTDSETLLDLKSLPKGMYVYKIDYGKGSQHTTGKIILE